jgi:ParB-like chromosome segregation protein Spo0J
MKTETVPIDSIHADPANVRRHPERNLGAIKASLARFGQVKPIVVDAKGIVRAGNGTLEAARALGWEKIAVVRTDLKGTEATAYAIADNRTAELAEWDDQGLAETLRALQSEDFDLAAVGYDAAEVDALIAGLADQIVGDPEDGETPFDDFEEAADPDGFVAFKLGDYSGRVGKDVYDSFVSAYKAKQDETGEIMLDDVLRGWLGV